MSSTHAVVAAYASPEFIRSPTWTADGASILFSKSPLLMVPAMGGEPVDPFNSAKCGIDVEDYRGECCRFVVAHRTLPGAAASSRLDVIAATTTV